MLTGDNGLLTKASTAKTETEHKTVVEALRIKFNEFQIYVSEGEATDFLEFLKNYESGAIVDENGVVNVENLIGRTKGLGTGYASIQAYASTQTDDMMKVASFNPVNVYVIEANQSIGQYVLNYYEKKDNSLRLDIYSGNTKIDWNKVFETAIKHPEQTENEDIGIDDKGEPVNLDIWKYESNGDGFTLNGGNAGCGGFYAGYSNDDIIDEKIQGNIPAFIKIESSDRFEPVTSLECTFWNCTKLTEAPEIPNSVTDMSNTFDGCTSLTKAPEIPSSVTNMTCTFLTCSKLTRAPEIPSNVAHMSQMFEGCSSISGDLVINVKTIEVFRCLKNVAKKEGCKLTIKGSAPKEILDQIFETAEGNPNVIKGY